MKRFRKLQLDKLMFNRFAEMLHQQQFSYQQMQLKGFLLGTMFSLVSHSGLSSLVKHGGALHRLRHQQHLWKKKTQFELLDCDWWKVWCGLFKSWLQDMVSGNALCGQSGSVDVNIFQSCHPIEEIMNDFNLWLCCHLDEAKKLFSFYRINRNSVDV